MKSLIGSVVLCVLVAVSWLLFHRAGEDMRKVQNEITEISKTGEDEERLSQLNSKFTGMEGERMFNGILLTIFSAVLLGIVFVTKVLPMFAHKFTNAVLASDEEVVQDPAYEARVMLAHGDWNGAVEAFKKAAQNDPWNRMHWVEIARIQKRNLDDSDGAVATLRDAIQGQDWEIDDAAYLMFRLADLYEEDILDRPAAALVYEQIIELFPETRHSANARTKLVEWGMA